MRAQLWTLYCLKGGETISHLNKGSVAFLLPSEPHWVIFSSDCLQQ